MKYASLIERTTTEQISPVYVIAEAGVNHNGDLGLARNLIRAAAASGADAVKFQTFSAERLALRTTPKVAYQRLGDGELESHFEMLSRLELPADWYPHLEEEALRAGVELFSTPYDVESVRFLAERCVPVLKIASADIVDHALLEEAARTSRPIILSTGMATLGEIESAVRLIRDFSCEPLTLLQCTSSYPCPDDSVDLRTMATLGKAFGTLVGFSDHTVGITAAVAAVALGAQVIERHLTMDREMTGPDHRASLDPIEFTGYVTAIRSTELALGRAQKNPRPVEHEMARVSRKSLVAARRLALGTTIAVEDVVLRRPGTGLYGSSLSAVIGRRLRRALESGEILKWSDLE